MECLSLPQGSTVFLGKAAKPMAQHLSDAIGDMVSKISHIREAYVPQCYVEGIVDPPAEILVLVLDGLENQPGVLRDVGSGLARILPSAVHLDVIVMNDRDKLLAMVRNAVPHIYRATTSQKKKWWRFGR